MRDEFLARANGGITVLVEHFAAVFSLDEWEPHKPLKIGINKDIAAAGIMPAEDIKPALRLYVQRLMYQRALAAGGSRYGLDGEPCGEITAKHAADADAIVAQREAKRVMEGAAVIAARKLVKADKPGDVWKGTPDGHKADTTSECGERETAALAILAATDSTAPIRVTTPAPASAIPTAPAKQRLGLADLKKAAQERRARQTVDDTHSVRHEIARPGRSP